MDHWTNFYTEEILAGKTDDTTVYGLGDGVDLIGVVSLSENPPSSYDQSDILHFRDHTAPARYMSMLAVRPDFRCAGMATDLMRFVEQATRASGIKFMRLDVIREYTELNTFYDKRGYGYAHWRFDGDDNSNFYEKEL